MSRSERRGPSKNVWLWTLYVVLVVIAVGVIARFGVAPAVLCTALAHLHVRSLPGLWWGVAGGFAYALGKFLIDCRAGCLEGGHGCLYLVQVVARMILMILGAIVGAATLAFGESGAFVTGVAGPTALVALGATFDRRKT
jgi:hypothetical protein